MVMVMRGRLCLAYSGGCCLGIGGTQGSLLHALKVGVVQIRQASNGEVEVARPRSLGMSRVRWLRRRRQSLVHGSGNDLAWSGKVRGRSHAVMGHLGRIHDHLRLGVLVMLGHGGMRLHAVRIRSLMDAGGRGSRELDRRAVLLLLLLVTGSLMCGRAVCLLMLALLSRMGILTRIVHIVVPYTICARQRASETWSPPERTALDGRRSLDGENLMSWSPFGLRRRGKRLVLLRERRCGNLRGRVRRQRRLVSTSRLLAEPELYVDCDISCRGTGHMCVVESRSFPASVTG